MRFRVIGLAAFIALAGCRTPLTLEEAEAACTRRGGLLTVIYTQEITAAGIGQRVGYPGACVSPKDFEARSSASSAAARAK